MILRRVAHAIVLSFGWRRSLIAFAVGAASALALAPFNFWPVLFFTFPVVVWLIDGVGQRSLGGFPAAAACGWFFGFGYFLAGLYWIGNAFLVDAATFGWLLPFAVTALPAGLALFTALGFALAKALWIRGAMRILALALALTAAEWLRGHVLTGFPWNAYGYALAGPLPLAQGAALVGLWGLTFLAVAIFASPAALADDERDTRRRWVPLALAMATIAVLAGYGTWRLGRTATAYVDGVKLRIVQPNLQQDEKFNYSAKQRVMSRYLDLSDRATGPQNSGLRDITHLIWPESAFPFFLSREPAVLEQIAAMLPANTVLITGGVRPAEAAPGARTTRAYNSIYVIDHAGSILWIYDKVHLVPFGEYLPFQNALEKLGLMQLTKLPGGFLAGDRHRLFSIPRAPRVLPLVCYEILFPGEAVPQDERPGWLLNVTNDGWFGMSTGPYQHFAQARLTAIEQGLPLVRAANTGISAVIDPLGRVVNSLPLGAEGVLDAPLPQQIASPFYVQMGGGLASLSLGIVFLIVMRIRMRG